MINCGSDYPSNTDLSYGVDIQADAGHFLITGFQSELTEYGITVEMTPGADNLGSLIVSDSYFGRNKYGINMIAGDLQASGNHFNIYTDGSVHPNGVDSGIRFTTAGPYANCRNNYFQNFDSDGTSVAIRELATNSGNRHFDLNLFRDTANQGVAT